MNSVAGGTVYFAGELVVQHGNSPSGFAGVNFPKCAELGLLGSCENGLLMSYWYYLLTKAMGHGASTQIVLAKCALDQIFFATQQDALFLGLCAYESFAEFEGNLVSCGL
jgi:hypothetical protein